MSDDQNIYVESPAERRARWLSVSISPSATPTRNGGAHAAQVKQTESRWAKDHAAVRRLAKDGVSFNNLDGAAELEARATDEVELRMGKIFEGKDLTHAREGQRLSEELGLVDGA